MNVFLHVRFVLLAVACGELDNATAARQTISIQYTSAILAGAGYKTRQFHGFPQPFISIEPQPRITKAALCKTIMSHGAFISF